MTKRKDKNNDNNNTNCPKNEFNSPLSSDSSSMFQDINFSELFNPHDKYINCGEKTSYDLMSYDLGIFSSLANIYKNLNIENNKLNSNEKFSTISRNKRNNDIEEYNNENIRNTSNVKENILSDSILKFLLSETNSENKKNHKKNNSEFSLNDEDLDELLKDYKPMEIDKKI